MYAPYFGLRQEPFSIAPDPRYLYMSERHREALAHLLYGLSSGGGFVLLTGEIGTGKTTVCRAFLEQVPAHCNVAYIFNPKLTALELLHAVCDEFGVAVPGTPGRQPTVKDHIDPLNAFLLAQHAAGRSNVLIIDEAQNLSADVLEQLRLLTNLETHERKLLQIILIGQPELRDMLERPELEQLAQRVIARYHLRPLNEAETARYVRHRLSVAGLERVPPFDPRVLRHIHRLSRGVPRRINLLCDRALLGAYARTRASVSRATLEQAADEVFGRRAGHPRAGRRVAAWSAAALAGVAALLVGAWGLGGPSWPAWPSWPAPAGSVAALPSMLAAPAVTPALAASGARESGSGRADEPPVAVASATATTHSVIAASAELLSDRDKAWRELARHWGAELDDKGAACPDLAAQGLQCFTSPMSLSLIRQLDRPGILTLDERTAKPLFALLVALGPDSATLAADGTEQTVTLRALAERWDGEFATLWRAPPGHSISKARPWVVQVLAKGEAGDAPASASLASRLRSFQLAQGLPATGTLVPTTFMQLNRAFGIDEPRLRPRP